MASQEDFDAAVAAVNNLPQAPAPNKQLELYGLFKQATSGDASGKRPGMLDVRGRAKYDAWAKNKGKNTETARSGYIALAQKLGAL